ncbi:LOW QUALITY PROTEIN: protein tyrosine phosphatase receptor type C-associated protein [Sarcophilus harrisii]
MARCRLGVLVALGALPGAGLRGSGSPSSVTVWLLVLLLLLLLAALALAWYHLNRESGGYYHPTRLGSSLGRRARLLRATGLTRWLRASAVEELQDSTEKQEDEEDEDDEEEEEEHLEPGREHGQQPEQKPKDGGPGGSQGLEAALVEAAPGEAKEDPRPSPPRPSPLRPGAAPGPSLPRPGLLSDLHAFSGSAAWEDGAGGGSHGLSVTALWRGVCLCLPDARLWPKSHGGIHGARPAQPALPPLHSGSPGPEGVERPTCPVIGAQPQPPDCVAQSSVPPSPRPRPLSSRVRGAEGPGRPIQLQHCG